MKMKKADMFIAIYILAAFIMFIVTLPSWLLGVLLAINIAIAFTIMFGTMFVKEVLDLSFYPTMLLFTTIFRIALNVSSTKLILGTGDLCSSTYFPDSCNSFNLCSNSILIF